jgi:lipoprotein-anchoring transpeptidase ErfK/SrfK
MKISRREFLQSAGIGLSGLVLPAWLVESARAETAPAPPLPDFPQAEQLGRVIGGRVPLKLRPDIDSQDVAFVNDDDVLPWLSEVVGKRPLWYSQRFVETPQGYVYAPNVQRVRNLPNKPLKAMPSPDGFWAEVTVPYVDLALANPPARSPWLKNGAKPRLYYSQVMFVDQMKRDESGAVWYHVKEKYGTFGDIFWAAAAAFRPVTADEIKPISPEIADKRVVVNLLEQSLTCLENGREVYFCRVSTGGKWDKDGNPSQDWATPLGAHSIWRKLVSVHMTGGSSGGGYDLSGIGWTTLFSGNGVAVHSTFWHNSYGIPKSHGCVNAQPEDAKWVFRWTTPGVPYAAGDVTISGSGSTKVEVVENS